MKSGETVLYFDAFNGVAGDMIVGALIDLGLPLEYLERELAKLNLGDEFSLSAAAIERDGLMGIDFKVHGNDPSAGEHVSQGPEHPHHHHHDGEPHHHHHHDHVHDHDHGHDHGHEHGHEHDHEHHHDHSHGNDQPHEHHHHGHHHHHSHDAGHGGRHRGFSDVKAVIEGSSLDERIKSRSIKIFENLALAEAKVHGSTVEDVHFHEVGAVDSLVDIVGACIGFDYLGIDRFYASTINLGGGTVRFSHGHWPVPAPATAELLEGLPCRLGKIEAELTTPTGAAIVATLVDRSVSEPVFSFEKSGFGAGDKAFPGIPNMLRLVLGFGAVRDAKSPVGGGLSGVSVESLVLLEANIDDMDAEMFGYFMERAMSMGALDAYFAPVHMKKNRPGIVLSVLCRREEQAAFAELIFKETTTLGLRVRPIERWTLDREQVQVETSFGPVRVKVGRLEGRIVTAQPEFEDLREHAVRSGVPLKQVQQEVRSAISRLES